MNNNLKLNIFIGVIIICFCFSLFILNIFSNKVLPIFYEYVESKLKVISTTIINNTILYEINNTENVDDLIVVTKNKEDEIQMIDFNYKIVNHLLTLINDKLLTNLYEIENSNAIFSNKSYKYNNGMIFEIPLGVLSNNVMLSNLGPKIPVKFNIVGDVITNINTEIKEYGINNALVQISAVVSIDQKVIIPFISKTSNISLSIPISIKLLQGNIPAYYGNGYNKNSNILSTPIQ